MQIKPAPDISQFAEFADEIRDKRVHSEQIVRQALDRAGRRVPAEAKDDLTDLSREIDGTFHILDSAAEELLVQNEALFAARTELEGTSAVFRDLFEFAPVAYLVTNFDARIMYANEAACTLLRCPKNYLVKKPLTCFVALNERMAFRTSILRAREANALSTWPASLSPRGATKLVNCRMRVRPASASEAQVPLALYWNITEETDEDLF
jgi:PAS domain-containing protein